MGAPLGARTLTVTNPDGQTASLVAGLIVGNGVNQPPVFGTVPADRTIFDGGIGGTSGPIAFTVSDPEAGPVTMTATSSNTTVVPPANITFGGADTSTARTVTIATDRQLRHVDGHPHAPATASLRPRPRFVVTVSPSAPPTAPQNLMAVVARNTVILTWQAPTSSTTEPVTGYRVEAGFSPGETLGTLALGNVLTHTITGAPSGVFYVRLRAQTAAGLSPPSNEVRLATGQSAPPLAPQALLATVQGTNIALRWTENPLGPAITGYYLQAGTAAGLADVGALPLPPTRPHVCGERRPRHLLRAGRGGECRRRQRGVERGRAHAGPECLHDSHRADRPHGRGAPARVERAVGGRAARRDSRPVTCCRRAA